MPGIHATIGRCWDVASCTAFDAAADWGLLFAALFAAAFAISFLLFHTWRDTPEGRTLGYLVLSLIGTYLLNVLGNLYDGDYWFREPLRNVVYWSVAAIFARFLYLLWRGDKGRGLTINAQRRNTAGTEKRKK